MTRELGQSLLLHSGLLGLAFIASFVLNRSPVHPSKPIKIEIREIAKPDPAVGIIKTTKEGTPPSPKVARAVFGISKNSLTVEKSSGVEVKAGNTITKEIDQVPMQADDAASLPTPTEEYLVTQMPRLKSEVRIPYPPEAKRKNISGAVTMEILIDETGKVRTAKLIEGPGAGLDEAALSAIYQFDFAPALEGKNPVAVKIRYAYRFVLN